MRLAFAHQREQVAIRIAQERHPQFARTQRSDEVRFAARGYGDASVAQRSERRIQIVDIEIQRDAGRCNQRAVSLSMRRTPATSKNATLGASNRKVIPIVSRQNATLRCKSPTPSAI